MSRISYLTAEELSDEQRRLAEKLAASRGGRLVGPGAFSVHLHIENAPGALTDDLGSGVLGEELWMWNRNRGMFVHGVSTPSAYGG